MVPGEFALPQFLGDMCRETLRSDDCAITALVVYQNSADAGRGLYSLAVDEKLLPNNRASRSARSSGPSTWNRAYDMLETRAPRTRGAIPLLNLKRTSSKHARSGAPTEAYVQETRAAQQWFEASSRVSAAVAQAGVCRRLKRDKVGLVVWNAATADFGRRRSSGVAMMRADGMTLAAIAAEVSGSSNKPGLSVWMSRRRVCPLQMRQGWPGRTAWVRQTVFRIVPSSKVSIPMPRR